MADPTDEHRQNLLQFVERFAALLEEAGFSRMSARVFAFVLAEDADRYTAADLAQGLNVSRAAVSGAVRPLVQSGFLVKEREPGRRAEVYRLSDDDVWSAVTQAGFANIERWLTTLEHGIALVGPQTQGGQRLRQSQAFFAFMDEEMPRLLERWEKRKQSLQ